MSCHINAIRCIHQQVEFSIGKISLLASVPIDPVVKGLESMEDAYIIPTTDTPPDNMELYPGIMRCKVVLCKNTTLPTPYTKVRFKW